MRETRSCYLHGDYDADLADARHEGRCPSCVRERSPETRDSPPRVHRNGCDAVVGGDCRCGVERRAGDLYDERGPWDSSPLSLVEALEVLAATLPEHGSQRHFLRAVAVRLRGMERALEAAAKSLTFLSTAGARNATLAPGVVPLEDMVDVRGYASSRAKMAWDALHGEDG